MVDNQTDRSSCDLNRAEFSALDEERRMEKMGKRIWRQTSDQNGGVKPLPCALSVSNKQSSALAVSRGPWGTLKGIHSQPPDLEVLAGHDDLVERAQDR